MWNFIPNNVDIEKLFIEKEDKKEFLDKVERVFNSLQKREKPIISDILTTKLWLYLDETDKKYSFISKKIAEEWKKTGILPTQREIASGYNRHEASVSTSIKNFRKKIEKEIIKEIIEFDLDEGRMDYLDDMIDVFSKDGCEMVDILFDRFLKKYYADIDVSNERMTINLTDEEGHVLSFNLSQSEVHYVLHMVERRLNSFMRDDGGGGFSDED